VSRLSYLDVELWALDVKLLGGQDSILIGQILQDHRQVDQVLPHHVLILGRGDLVPDHFDWRRERERGAERPSETACGR